MTLRTKGPNGKAWLATYGVETANMTRGYGTVQGAADGNVKAPTGAGQACVGVLTESTVNVGDFVAIAEAGQVVAIGGATAIAAGNYVKMDANGKFIPVTGTNGGGEKVAGRAISSTAADGDEFVLFVSPFVY